MLPTNCNQVITLNACSSVIAWFTACKPVVTHRLTVVTCNVVQFLLPPSANNVLDGFAFLSTAVGHITKMAE